MHAQGIGRCNLPYPMFRSIILPSSSRAQLVQLSTDWRPPHGYRRFDLFLFPYKWQCTGPWPAFRGPSSPSWLTAVRETNCIDASKRPSRCYAIRTTSSRPPQPMSPSTAGRYIRKHEHGPYQQSRSVYRMSRAYKHANPTYVAYIFFPS